MHFGRQRHVYSGPVPIGHWLGWGALWGFAGLTEPMVLSVLPFLGGWVCYRRYRQGRRWFFPAAVAALTFIAFVSPWFIRNYVAFHRFIPFRDSFCMESVYGQ